jgi:nicotinate-nucleotide adenylyltransferase
VGAVIGILGGTFDPPHIAHAVLAEEAFYSLDLTSVLWVLTAQPPHKPESPISSVEHRIEMVKLVTQMEPHFELSRADLDREAPHYAVGTLSWLRERYPGERFAYIMGSDSLRDLPTWHTPRAFVDACDLIAVMKRKDADFEMEDLEEQIPGIQAKLTFFQVPQLEIAGHEIRRRVKESEAWRFFVLPDVADYIEANTLYL